MKNKKEISLIGMSIMCIVIIIVCLISCLRYENNIYSDKKKFIDLKDLVSESEYSPPATVDSNDFSIIKRDNNSNLIGESENNLEIETSTDSDIKNISKIVKDYTSLKDKNNDFVGWINIPETKIDYPVMQTNNNPDYYLRRDFYKEYSDLGTPYVEEGCDVNLPSDNIIIYGHHIKNGLIFAALEKYKDKSFYENHKYINFDTINSNFKYEIISVFKTVVYTGKDDEFKYWEFINSETSTDFDNYIYKIKELSLYDIPVTANYGDKLITLSTCEYSNENGRLVIVAKRISNN